MRRYILNSAVITSPGDYRYEIIDADGSVSRRANQFVTSAGAAIAREREQLAAALPWSGL